MVEIVAIHPLDNCLDSSPVRAYELSEPVDENLMHRLATGAKLQYFPQFPRPYFRVDRAKAFVVQGILGDPTLQVTFSPRAGDREREELRRAVEQGDGS